MKKLVLVLAVIAMVAVSFTSCVNKGQTTGETSADSTLVDSVAVDSVSVDTTVVAQ